ncbi:MAG TPA: FAD-dependent monooxygenase [Actinomycetota bacterium]|nr:FAD-dependent monooxygenase [Actinomycetota bacterium]
MRICVVGGGPGGLYAALLLKKADPSRHVELFEKNPADATYGWGVVFSDRTLTSFREADYQTYEDITDAFVMWEAIDVRIKDVVVRCEGQVFSGIARKALLGILQQRCADLGVELHWQTEITDTNAVEDFDLVVAADGVHSLWREQLVGDLAPRITEGVSRYIWFGTSRSFDSFTFAFRETEHGLFQAHAYPFDGTTGTFIVECRSEVWRSAGLDRSSEHESIAFCEKVFREDLNGASLMSNSSKWLTFPTLRCKRWRSGNVVLLGDAVHTAHFSIGSGTKLAMEDSIGLAEAMRRHDSIGEALAEYEMDRRPRVEAFQEAARQSQTYFENTARYMDMQPLQFAFHLLTRSGRVGYSELRLKDPDLVGRVDALVSGTEKTVAPTPAFNELTLRGTGLANRVALTLRPTDSAENGLPDEAMLSDLERAARSGAGLLFTDVVAPSADGRITSGSPGIYDDSHEATWAGALGSSGPGRAAVVLHLGHAGARGATAPRTFGVDVALAEDGWDLLAASPVAYAPAGRTPKEMDRSDMERVVVDFVEATERAKRAGFDAVGLHAGQGYLLGGFLSPATNLRTDEYGGSLEARARWPLEVLAAVRTAWAGQPLIVTLNAVDWGPRGADLKHGIELAWLLRKGGCDLLRVTAGQATFASKARYDPYWLMHYCDVLRNEVGIAAMPALSLPTVDAINSAIGAGRADVGSLRTDPKRLAFR